MRVIEKLRKIKRTFDLGEQLSETELEFHESGIYKSICRGSIWELDDFKERWKNMTPEIEGYPIQEKIAYYLGRIFPYIMRIPSKR